MARPSYEPTPRDREQVKALAAMGVPQLDIATVLQISAPTLRKHFWQELEVGSIEANAKVAQSLFRQATDKEKPSVVAAIFWLKCRGGWSESGALPPPREETLGKKAAAAADAQVAQVGTEWAELLPAGRPPLQ